MFDDKFLTKSRGNVNNEGCVVLLLSSLHFIYYLCTLIFE